MASTVSYSHPTEHTTRFFLTRHCHGHIIGGTDAQCPCHIYLILMVTYCQHTFSYDMIGIWSGCLTLSTSSFTTSQYMHFSYKIMALPDKCCVMLLDISYYNRPHSVFLSCYLCSTHLGIVVRHNRILVSVSTQDFVFTIMIYFVWYVSDEHTKIIRESCNRIKNVL